ncbi:MAG: hypothetical protein COV46_02905 [Deltaproteobacteria bacterium CG11_big_fil_rev_8_21_14_0_20_49_13]|nr:MAG: hypothetical protein COV46_02905 [Deltaproteobacteria bacterium CG11_big_fil_rev_8_21_14_0_20_49_13]
MVLKRAIIGVGNRLMGDEGVGIHAIEYLRKATKNIIRRDLSPSKSAKKGIIKKYPPLGVRPFFDILDGGTGGITLLHMFESYDRVILIDAANFGATPGTLKTFDLKEINFSPDSAQVSLHGTSLAGILELAKKLGTKLPRITIIAVQPKKICPSMELSVECKNAIPKIAEIVRTSVGGNAENVLKSL